MQNRPVLFEKVEVGCREDVNWKPGGAGGITILEVGEWGQVEWL